jgi:glucose/arabinose dehydrogenase
VQKAMAPDYALGAHTASLGLAFNTGNLFPPEMKDGAFIGQHGSWNRKPRAGYKVIFVPFKDGKPSGAPQDVLTGCSTRRARRRDAPSASGSTSRARCWSPTTSATRSGG